MYAKGFNVDNLFWNDDGAIVFDKSADVPTNGSYTVWAGMDVQFSLKEKFFIETGLNFRESPYVYGENVSEIESLYRGGLPLVRGSVRRRIWTP